MCDWRRGREAGCLRSSSHHGLQSLWLLLSMETRPGQRGWVASPPGMRPLPKHAAIEQRRHPFLRRRQTAVPGLRRAGTCSPVAGLFDQGIFGSTSPPTRRGEACWLCHPACLHRPPAPRQVPGTTVPGRSAFRFTAGAAPGAAPASLPSRPAVGSGAGAFPKRDLGPHYRRRDQQRRGLMKPREKFDSPVQ